MRGMIGCAGLIAIVPLILGIIGSLFIPDVSIGERLVLGAMPGAFVFAAALMLFVRDGVRHTVTMRAVRKKLLTRMEVNEHDFVAQFPNLDQALINQTRQAISQFFDVPVEKIHPTDNLRTDLKFDFLEPGFHTFVIYKIFSVRNVAAQPFTFSTSNLTNIGDLAKEIQRVLDKFESAKQDAHDLQ